MSNSMFGSEKIITEHISNADLKTYFVGFDIDDDGDRFYRLDNLVQVLVNVIPDFAFGLHEGTSFDTRDVIDKIREAAQSIYRIKEFSKVNEIYQQGRFISDDDISTKYLRRGEFGELILHLLLRDFHNTIPLLSKIYFKDSYGSAVHGFDAVHIQPKNKILWLGESKLYHDGQKGVKALIEDIKNHFMRDYLTDEFAIISKKLKPYNNIPEKDYWFTLMDKRTKLEDVLKSVTIPLLCTYSSKNFEKHDNEKTKEFLTDYEEEVLDLKKKFDENNDCPIKTNLNIILMLFPIKCKNDLVKKLHQKIFYLQMI